MGKRVFAILLNIAVVAVLATGCVRHTQYRTSAEPCTVQGSETICENAVQEQHDGYQLSFVEFDDQGWLWDRAQMTKTLDTLRSQEYLESGVIMLVFVHGWKHNAAFDDPNVLEFRKMLRRVHKLEYLASKKENRPARKVAGTYLAWRGQSAPGVLSSVTFWDRKNVANTVGHGALTEFLLQLENVQIAHLEKEKGRAAQTKLIVIGHSFGGQIVYSALSQIFLDRFVDLEGAPPQTFGDLVILVNPAFEAARFSPLREASRQRKYPAGQVPLITIFTAKNDGATGVAFPLGRWFSTFFEKHRDGDQKSSNREAIGHFEPYISHELTWVKTVKPVAELTSAEETKLTAVERERSDLEATRADLAITSMSSQQWLKTTSRAGWSLDFGSARLAHLVKTEKRNQTDPCNPFYVISVDKEIIDGHGGIWTPAFADFLRRFILLSMNVPESP